MKNNTPTKARSISIRFAIAYATLIGIFVVYNYITMS